MMLLILLPNCFISLSDSNLTAMTLWVLTITPL